MFDKIKNTKKHRIRHDENLKKKESVWLNVHISWEKEISKLLIFGCILVMHASNVIS